MPDVTVVLRTLNAEHELGGLLDTLGRQTRPPDEILVVDSGSRDRTREVVERAGARVVDLPPERFSHAVSTNLGFREARGEIVAMLSQDALPSGPEWLAHLTAPFTDPRVAAAFGRQAARPGAFPLERWELERAYPAEGDPDVPYSNVNSAARRSVWERFPFPEDVRIAEDRFWALRVMEAGHRVVYVPEAVVWHSHEYSIRDVFRRCREEARAKREMEGRTEGWNLVFAAWPKQTVRDALRLRAEGRLRRWPRASAYRLAQFLGMSIGGRSRGERRPLARREESGAGNEEEG